MNLLLVAEVDRVGHVGKPRLTENALRLVGRSIVDEEDTAGGKVDRSSRMTSPRFSCSLWTGMATKPGVSSSISALSTLVNTTAWVSRASPLSPSADVTSLQAFEQGRPRSDACTVRAGVSRYSVAPLAATYSAPPERRSLVRRSLPASL